MQDLENLKVLAGITNNTAKLQEYRLDCSCLGQGSNPSVTANEKIQYQKTHNIKPGTPEWFRLWFALPLMTNEKPF